MSIFDGLLGGLAGAFGSLGGGVLNYFGAQQANAQNMLMNTGQWKAEQIGTEAKMLGVSPLALLGQNFQPTPAQNVFADAGSTGASIGQNLARAFASGDSDSAKRLNDLREQNLMLQNASLQNDVIAGQMRNTANRLKFQPATPPARPLPNFSLDDVWGSVHRGTLAPKPGLQAVMRPNGEVYYIPSATVQSGLWSPVPGLPANPQATADVVRANAAGIPPDVARMTGLPPGSIDFVPGTGRSFYERYLAPDVEGRDDPSVYGRSLY